MAGGVSILTYLPTMPSLIALSLLLRDNMVAGSFDLRLAHSTNKAHVAWLSAGVKEIDMQEMLLVIR